MTRLRVALTIVVLGAVSLLVACGGRGNSAPPSYTIGGTVSGLADTGLVLRSGGADSLSIATNGPFTFASRIANGSAYLVTVYAQPASQTCTVSNGSGTMGTSDIASVSVTCVTGFSLAGAADPLASQEWHLKNTGQSGFADFGGVAGMDINVDPVYNAGQSGKGVIVAIVDSGMEIAHEDLAANVLPGGSWNFINNTTNPTNSATTGDHGTSVAGIIAMARNAVGGLGVAPAASLKAFNFLSASQSISTQVNSLGASASNPNSADAAVFNQSYGISPMSDTPIDPTVEAQFAAGSSLLRGGKGALYVKAAGNGYSDTVAYPTCPLRPGMSCENSNFDPENAIPYQIVVGAINANGLSASYASVGSSVWITAPGGEGGFNASVAGFGYTPDVYQPAIITADQSGCTKGYSVTAANTSEFDNGLGLNSNCNYTSTMDGSSAAVPVTTGVIALLLEANPALTWRDVKHILATTARKIHQTIPPYSVTLPDGPFVAEPAWTTNAAGYSFHNWYGFGMVDASAAVNMAKTYASGQLGSFADTGWISSGALALAIPDNSVTGATHALTVPATPAPAVEAVQIRVTATHTWTGDLAIELTSPSGTRSVLKNGNDGFNGAQGLNGMLLLSNAFYGEPAAGNWTIKVVDATALDSGTLTQWEIRVFGH
ncbi:MAG: S8 family serine peptidase [Betaproteobacteria bacterium]|nr:S8 family serine peptidase [Betaproteobacteria bacterium]